MDLPETTRLTVLEQIVENSARAMWQMAEALAEIHSEELYKETHKTWQSYVEERWGLTKNYTHKVIRAVAARDRLKVSPGATLPANLTQAVELAGATPGDQAEVWADAVGQAVKDGKRRPTKRDVTAAVQRSRDRRFPPATVEPDADDVTSDERRIALRALKSVGDDGLRAVLSLETVTQLGHHLSEAEIMGLAVSVAHTVSSMSRILVEAGWMRADVADGLLSEFAGAGV